MNWLLLRRRALMKEAYDPYAGWVVGGFYGSTFQTNRTWGLTSDYIPVQPNTTYSMKLGWNNKENVGDYAFNWGYWYTSSKQGISYISGRQNANSAASFKSPANAAYCRVTVWKSKKDTCYMRKGTSGEYIFKGKKV